MCAHARAHTHTHHYKHIHTKGFPYVFSELLEGFFGLDTSWFWIRKISRIQDYLQTIVIFELESFHCAWFRLVHQKDFAKTGYKGKYLFVLNSSTRRPGNACLDRKLSAGIFQIQVAFPIKVESVTNSFVPLWVFCVVFFFFFCIPNFAPIKHLRRMFPGLSLSL